MPWFTRKALPPCPSFLIISPYPSCYHPSSLTPYVVLLSSPIFSPFLSCATLLISLCYFLCTLTLLKIWRAYSSTGNGCNRLKCPWNGKEFHRGHCTFPMMYLSPDWSIPSLSHYRKRDFPMYIKWTEESSTIDTASFRCCTSTLTGKFHWCSITENGNFRWFPLGLKNTW